MPAFMERGRKQCYFKKLNICSAFGATFMLDGCKGGKKSIWTNNKACSDIEINE